MVATMTMMVTRMALKNWPTSSPPACPKSLLKRFWMAVFQASAATRPRAVVIRVENLSRTSAVNGLSFRSFWPAAGPVVVDGTVFWVGVKEVLDGVGAPAHDHLLGLFGELGADVCLAADAAAHVLPRGLPGAAFEAFGVEEPARCQIPDHQQVHL